MDYFPAFLQLRDRACLVVGGGAIALRKIRLLDSAGARLTIVASTATDGVREFAARNGHVLTLRPFVPDDVIGNWLVVSATGDPQVETCVYEHATLAGIFCNGVDDIEHCSYITPAIVDRGSLVIGVSSGGTAPVLARKIRARIEAMLPAGLSTLATLSARWRAKVRDHFDDLLSRRQFWESVFDGPAGSLAIAGDTAAAEHEMTALLNVHQGNVHERGTSGEAWLVGAGPGDPGLLTLRALQVLQLADVILHDRLVSADILELARRDADLVSVAKIPGCAANSQDDINAMLVELVQSGKRVCRLKGGDPFIFGRGGEEAEVLGAAGLICHIVPGITAAAGCAAYAGIPLTHRDHAQSVAFVTAHGKNSVDKLDWAGLARDQQTLAFYMAVRRFPELMNKLIDNGRSADTPVAIIERGTTAEQRVIRGTLGQLTLLAAAHKVAPPAMLIVGEVAALAVTDGVARPQMAMNSATPDSTIAQKITQKG